MILNLFKRIKKRFSFSKIAFGLYLDTAFLKFENQSINYLVFVHSNTRGSELKAKTNVNSFFPSFA